MTNKPPYAITEKTADYLAKIVEAVIRLELGTGLESNTRLLRENRLIAIHSSLAIEGNTLTLGEVTAVIDGRPVAGRQTEIKEVRNAYEAYDNIMAFNPYSISDFMQAHKLMTEGLVKESGRFRSGNVGVFDGDTVVHMGARPQFVPQLMEELFGWANRSELHPVLKSAILHYEIETIHPFADGNGRMGRLWQTLVLAKWNALFAWMPMESVLYKNRLQYYKAIEDSRDANDSGAFIEFTLSAILDIVKAQEKHIVEHRDEHIVEHRDGPLSDTMVLVLKVLESGSLSRKEIFSAIGMKNDFRTFERNIGPLLDGGYIEMTIPEKPNSKLQRYKLTERGRKR